MLSPDALHGPSWASKLQTNLTLNVSIQRIKSVSALVQRRIEVGKAAERQRAQDKQTVLAAVGDLSLDALQRARRDPKVEVSAAAERLIARIDRNKSDRDVKDRRLP